MKRKIKKVYLDSNVLIEIENNSLLEQSLMSIEDNAYFYSSAHVEELVVATDVSKVSHLERLMLIKRICGDRYILSKPNAIPEFFKKEPSDEYQLLSSPDMFFWRQQIQNTVNSKENSIVLFRELLGFDANQFNNEKPESVLRIIDDRMKGKFGIDLVSYLQQTEGVSGRPLYVTLIQLIDMAKYWGDVKTQHSNMARQYDASHAYFAQICDILVTNDKRMRKKVQAVYSFLNVGTKVVSMDEFLTMNSFCHE